MLAKVQTSQALWTNPGLGFRAAKDKMHLETNAITVNSAAGPNLLQVFRPYQNSSSRGPQIWLHCENPEELLNILMPRLHPRQIKS